jgi:predicted phosphodiesterase
MPRIALISDIHGNLEAFDAVLRAIAADDIDQIVCLGDIVGYGPDPGRCVELAFTVCDQIVLGNHDEAAISERVACTFNPRAAAAIAVTRDLLDDMHVQMLRSLPDLARTGPLSLAHASFGPRQYEYLTGADAAARSFDGMRTPLGAVGHTHMPALYLRQRRPAGAPTTPTDPTTIESRAAVDGVLHKLDALHDALINPGSVGQPRDRNPDASWAVIDTDAATFQIKRCTYDVDAVSAKIDRLGMPEFHGQRLRVGA